MQSSTHDIQVEDGQLDRSEALSSAYTSAALLLATVLRDPAPRAIVASLVAGVVFFAGSLGSLWLLRRRLVPTVIGSAVAGSLAGAVYGLIAPAWSVGVLNGAGLGAVAGATIAPFQLIFLHGRRALEHSRELLDDSNARLEQMGIRVPRRRWWFLP
jgi:hypothetical protein